MMKKTYIVANWKANKTITEAKTWINEVKSGLPKLSPNLEVILCLPLIHLHLFKELLPSFKLAVQNLSPYTDGAYTGEVSARMLAGLADYALLGHSERHQYFHETTDKVALKVTQSLENSLTPIIALQPKLWRKQLNQLNRDEISRCLFMYEPPEAISRQVGLIGKGEATPINTVISAVQEIKPVAPVSPILYGGSVKSQNLAEFLDIPMIDGVVIGSASLNSSEWLKILAISQDSRG